ncbi:hypothetical protein PTTG_28438 [Puccinia triticina 1-1 BBBD Race 1]|uniref:Uncharacterized protein n=1 Tax=Puccinia triticina (isolate 1-1 / race 1 (BBBD)) TaxID=630390 RepID=A0A180GBF8_PUCT1|nr:hypothetical protein PTTG_28438 [Puccinia triticina 1-1 BBBD Race 1]
MAVLAVPNQQPNNTRGQHFPPPQYTAYYLILAPPVPTASFHQLPAKPVPPTGTNLQPANIYRPVYPKDTRSGSSQLPAAREAEVLVPTKQPSAQNMELDGIDGQPIKGNAHFSWGKLNAYGHQ